MPIPKNAIELSQRLGAEESCLALLNEVRWAKGFISQIANMMMDISYTNAKEPVINQ